MARDYRSSAELEGNKLFSDQMKLFSALAANREDNALKDREMQSRVQSEDANRAFREKDLAEQVRHNRANEGLLGAAPQQQRLETAELSREFEKNIGPARKQAGAIKDVEALLNNPTGLTEGNVRTALARLGGEVGVLTDKDIERQFPKSYGSSIKEWFNNKLLGRSEPTLPQGQVEGIRKHLESLRGPIEERIHGGEAEIRARGNQIAPTLARQGSLDNTLKSFGIGTGLKNQQPQQAQPTPQVEQNPIQNTFTNQPDQMNRLMELRKKYGR